MKVIKKHEFGANFIKFEKGPISIIELKRGQLID